MGEREFDENQFQAMKTHFKLKKDADITKEGVIEYVKFMTKKIPDDSQQ